MQSLRIRFGRFYLQVPGEVILYLLVRLLAVLHFVLHL